MEVPNAIALHVSVPELPSHVLIRLAAQQGLLGAIPPSLRVVTAHALGTVAHVCFVFDGPILDDDLESARIATTEIIAAFQSPWTLEERFIRLDYPAELNEFPYFSRVYERKELSAEGLPLS